MHSIQEGSSLAAFPAISPQLLAQAEQDSFDLGVDWFALFSDTALQPGQRPRWLHGTGPAGQQMLLPLMQEAQGGGRMRSLTNFYSTLYRPLLTTGVAREDMAAWLRQWAAKTRPSMVSFDAMDVEHPAFQALESGLRDAGLLPYRFFAFGNWYLKAEGLSWEAYLKTLSSKLRNTLKRLGRKFAEESAGRFEIVTPACTPEQVLAALAAYETVYASSWKVPEPFPQFLPGLVQLAARKGWLRLGVAYAGEQPVAAQIWLVVAGRACIYKVGYDEKFSAFSPGALLTGQLMQHVLEIDKVREVDYLMGDDTYKRIWMSDRRERWGLVAYNPKTLTGLALAGREAAWRRIKPVWTRWRERGAAKGEAAAAPVAKGEEEDAPAPTPANGPANGATSPSAQPKVQGERKAAPERKPHNEHRPPGERKPRGPARAEQKPDAGHPAQAEASAPAALAALPVASVAKPATALAETHTLTSPAAAPVPPAAPPGPAACA